MNEFWKEVIMEDVDGNFYLQLPKDLIEGARWKKDDILRFDVTNSDVMVVANITACNRKSV